MAASRATLLYGQDKYDDTRLRNKGGSRRAPSFIAQNSFRLAFGYTLQRTEAGIGLTLAPRRDVVRCFTSAPTRAEEIGVIQLLAIKRG